jgi:GNAT superfamily N-acetyltransferase
LTADLKQRSVEVETKALASVHEVATGAQKTSLGLGLYSRDGCAVSVCEAEQGIMLNRSTGLGVFQPADEDLLGWAIQHYREHKVGRAFIAITEGSQPDTLPGHAVSLGLGEARAWTKFLRDTSPARQGQSPLMVRPLEEPLAGDWGRIVACCFDMPEATGPLLAQLVHHPGWRLFMSFSGDQPVGAAGMFVHQGMAWFDWAATLPGFRGMGSQGTLMRARIEAAATQGCSEIMTATGEAVEGDPQHSWGNIGRYGFKPVFRTRNFAFDRN